MELRWLLTLLFSTTLACTTLPDIEPEGCGNRVINEGEDCDGDGPSPLGATLKCGETGANACFFECEPTDEAPNCPPGWRCGDDQRCRQASGTFTEAAVLGGDSLDEFAIGDVDGDGRRDLIGSSGQRLSVRYGDGDGDFPDGFDQLIPLPTGGIQFTSFNDDGTTDALVPIELGFFTLLGTNKRTLDPFHYAPFTLPLGTEAPRAVGLQAYLGPPLDAALGEEVLLFVNDVFFFPESEGFGDAGLTDMPDGLLSADLATYTASGDLDDNGLTDIALLFGGIDRAYLYTPAGATGDIANPLRMTEFAITSGPEQADHEILAPDGFTIGYLGGHFMDVTSDGLLDLVFEVHDIDDVIGVAVARNLGNGTMEAQAQLVDVFCLDDSGSAGQCALPLAAGDFNKDGVTDYVDRDVVALAIDLPVPDDFPDDYIPAGDPSTFVGWEEAVVLDINGDGWPDVAASNPNLPFVDILLNVGDTGEPGFFNPFSLPTERFPSQLRVGDFNGDLIEDVAFLERFNGLRADRMSVIYGSPGGPELPIDMGDIGEVDSVVSVSLFFGPDGVDQISDLFLIARAFLPEGVDLPIDEPLTFVSVMMGHSSGKLVASFLLPAPQHYPVAAVPGHFGDLDLDIAEGVMDVAAVLSWGFDDPTADFGLIALLAGVFGQGDLGLPGGAVGRLPRIAEFNPACAEFISGQLDADATSEFELIGIDYGEDCGDDEVFHHRLMIVRNLGATLFPTEMPEPPPPFLDHQTAVPLDTLVYDLAEGAQLVRNMELVDLDEDGLQDLLLVFAGRDSDGLLLILWNRDECGEWRLCESQRTLLRASDYFPASMEVAILDAAPIQLDATPAPELVAFTSNGLHVLQLGADGQYELLPESLDDSLVAADLGGSIETGDIDHDGLDDIVSSTPERIQVFLHQPAPTYGDYLAALAREGESGSESDAGP